MAIFEGAGVALITPFYDNGDVNYDKLEEFIKNNKIEAKMWGTSNIYNFMDRDTETIIHFLLVFQAIDFCFWGNPKWSIKNEEETISKKLTEEKAEINKER